MFTLYDNRTQLYQWDLNRKVIVSNSDICEVHFCNRTSDCSLVVEPYWEDAKYIANIPNVLLQDARPIRVYAYIDDEYTLAEEQFTVKSRTKPADYVYTETEIKSYDYLKNKIDAIEAQGFDEATVSAAVDNHFEQHPIEFELKDDGEGNVTLQLNLIPDAEEVSY